MDFGAQWLKVRVVT